jgi:hypothetical protein
MYRVLLAGAVALALAAAALAQRRFFDGEGYSREPAIHNVPYDGQFTFVRIKYETAPGGYWAGGRPSWAHGFPLAEWNLMKIMNEVSYLGANQETINTLTLDDPELFKYPVAYIIEVSWWTLSDREAAALRAYLQKGGFLIVDDFKVEGWRGLPGGDPRFEPGAEVRDALDEVVDRNRRRLVGDSPDLRLIDRPCGANRHSEAEPRRASNAPRLSCCRQRDWS